MSQVSVGLRLIVRSILFCELQKQIDALPVATDPSPIAAAAGLRQCVIAAGVQYW